MTLIVEGGEGRREEGSARKVEGSEGRAGQGHFHTSPLPTAPREREGIPSVIFHRWLGGGIQEAMNERRTKSITPTLPKP
jgi:hypothetical protein